MDRNKIILTVLYVILIGAFVYFAWSTKLFGLVKTTSTTGEWQAVFLTNGQVYFGKLSNANGAWPTLKEIYYLQVQQQVQPTSGTDTANQNPNLTLVKLGNELHAPTDEMSVNKDQILFWENLKNDGKVVQAIQKYKTEGPTPASSATPSPSATK